MPAFPSPQNPWTGAIHMYPMMGARPAAPFYHNPAGVLGPRPAPPRPAPQGYMALPAPSVPVTYTYPGYPTYGSSSAPTWHSSALANYFNGMTLQASSDYYMDTRASAHLSSDAGNLSSLSPPRDTHVTIGNGSSIPITHSVHAFLPTANSSRSLTLRVVLVTPCIVKNLIFVRQFTTDNFCSVEFDPWGFLVKDLRTGAMILRCSNLGDLYPLTSPPCSLTISASDSTLWHQCLGHPDQGALQCLASSNFLPFNKVPTNSSICHASQLGHHVRLPFLHSTTNTHGAFKLFHCGLWTSPMESVSSYKYFLVILDDFTHYLWMFSLQQKSEVFPCCLTFATTLLPNSPSHYKLFRWTMDVNLTTALFMISPPRMGFYSDSRVPTRLHKMVKPNVLFAPSMILFVHCSFKIACHQNFG
jgi:hypothetical protein